MTPVVGPHVSGKSLKISNYSRIECQITNNPLCHFLAVKIFFSELKYMYIEAQEAYTVLALMCDIGGALGLILGSTMLTLCEFGDFLISLAISGFKVRASPASSNVGKLNV